MILNQALYRPWTIIATSETTSTNLTDNDDAVMAFINTPEGSGVYYTVNPNGSLNILRSGLYNISSVINFTCSEDDRSHTLVCSFIASHPDFGDISYEASSETSFSYPTSGPFSTVNFSRCCYIPEGFILKVIIVNISGDDTDIQYSKGTSPYLSSLSIQQIL